MPLAFFHSFGIRLLPTIPEKNFDNQVHVFFRDGWETRSAGCLSYSGALPAFKSLTPFSISTAEKSGIWLPSSFWQKLRQSPLTLRSCLLSLGALATLTRWQATALALTGGWDIRGGRCAAPSRRMRPQLFRLESVKSSSEVPILNLLYIFNQCEWYLIKFSMLAN